jgi:hypothetical protein
MAKQVIPVIRINLHSKQATQLPVASYAKPVCNESADKILIFLMMNFVLGRDVNVCNLYTLTKTRSPHLV